MKNTKTYFALILVYLLTNSLSAQSTDKLLMNDKAPYKYGEYLKFRIHFGFMNAGFATLKLDKTKKNGVEFFYAKGHGWTTGAAKMFYVVNDIYESQFTKGADVKPVFFKRRVDEDGYLIQRDLTFNHQAQQVKVKDLKKDTIAVYNIGNDVQDMVSSFYYLRNINLKEVKTGDEVTINLFFDGETFPFKLRFEAKETIRTRFGKVKTWRVRPLVQKGRVFESKESLTLWITDDDNKIPIRIKASLAVGSLKADLHAFNGLANKFSVVKK